MKSVQIFATAVALLVSTATFAQRIKVVEGDLSSLKNEAAINIEFSYDNMKVGKFDSEKEYVDKKKNDYNKKEAGKGDNWAQAWVDDREARFEPRFNSLFMDMSRMMLDRKAKYTLVFKTTRTEPGMNVLVYRKNAEIDAEVWIVETANKDKVVAKLTVSRALGRTFGGYDLDTGLRISEAYEDAGKALGYFVKNQY